MYTSAFPRQVKINRWIIPFTVSDYPWETTSSRRVHVLRISYTFWHIERLNIYPFNLKKMQLNSNKLLLCISILLIPNFVLLQNEYTQRISCLVKIQSERKNKWLVDVIKNSGHWFEKLMNKGNNKITELRTILQRESQNSYLYKQTKSVNNRKTVKTVMTLTWYRHF
jgi:uncharacterized membrane protein YwzB